MRKAALYLLGASNRMEPGGRQSWCDQVWRSTLRAAQERGTDQGTGAACARPRPRPAADGQHGRDAAAYVTLSHTVTVCIVLYTAAGLLGCPVWPY